MTYNPQFKRSSRWSLVPPNGVVVQSERSPRLLRGAVFYLLAPFLDGQHTIEEITASLHGQVPDLAVRYAFKRLEQWGYIVPAAPSVPSEQAAFWDLLDRDPQETTKRLQDTAVSLVSFGSIDPTPFESILTSLGMSVRDDGQYTVVLTDDYLRDGLDGLNRAYMTQGRPWLLCKPVGTELWLGPLFLPGQTGCWACLAHRLRGVRKVDSFLQEQANGFQASPLARATLPSTLHTGLNLAATEVAKWIAGVHNKDLEGQIVTLDVLSLEKRNHVLVRRPQCPQCGDPSIVAANQNTPLVLQSQKKGTANDGGQPVRTHQEVLSTLADHVSPITGIVGSLRSAPLSEVGHKTVPSFVASHNFVHMPKEDVLDPDALNQSLLSSSMGKGRSPVQAQVSALGEAIERYSATFQGDEARIRGRLDKLPAPAVPPNTCMLHSEQQFAQREEWNARGTRSTWVPEPFEPDTEIDWSPMWSLTANEPRYVPTAYCFYGYSRKHKTWFARADSNGCAAGNSKEEAIFQGFMELVERDSIALWWYNRLRKPGVDMSLFPEPYFQQQQAHYTTLHRDIWVLDITSDIPIPTFVAISRRNDVAAEDIIFGFGAHFNPNVALLRALTELNQWLPVVNLRTPHKDDRQQYSDPEAVQWWETATVANQPYLVPDTTIASSKLSNCPGKSSDDFATDVMTCVQLAKDKGLETLVLDQTRPDAGLHVVKVIVPGLRHFWPRFGPGRLYDIPIQMGWLKKPLPEDGLNPQHIFF